MRKNDKMCDCNQGRLPCTCKPAEQHQGEPVTLPERLGEYIYGDPDSIGTRLGVRSVKAYGWNACLDEIAKLGPLYPHADPAEVERLRADLKHLMNTSVKGEVFDIVCKERDTLRDQLAEAEALSARLNAEAERHARSLAGAHALLREALKLHIGLDLAGRIDAALSASAEPCAPIKMQPLEQPFAQILADNADDLILKSSAPVEHDERADFEADVNKRYPGTLLALSASKARPGQYANLYVQSAWDAWQARAALERKTQLSDEDRDGLISPD